MDGQADVDKFANEDVNSGHSGGGRSAPLVDQLMTVKAAHVAIICMFRRFDFCQTTLSRLGHEGVQGVAA